jgi:energy-coupling factor transporter ATP-binding protein EcfA2
MPLLSQKEVLNLKLSSIPTSQLRELASSLGLNYLGTNSEIIKILLEEEIDERIIDRFIKQKYEERIQARRSLIADRDLQRELMKVKTFSWGVVQGQLDQKIQAGYVRKFVRYEDLLRNVKATLHDDVTNYVICTWFNHWTTVLIEEHIGIHPRIIPTLKNVKGIDIFFDRQPFDLKVTYLPHEYDPVDAIKNPSKLAIWMYENQGAQRFGADNRLFVVLLDKNNPERSWELKRDFGLVFQKIDNFFDKETVSKKDEVVFTFKRKTYTAVTKVLTITK